MGHRLQTGFASVQGEGDYVDRVRALIEAGDFHAAETLLMADIAALDTPLAQMCASTSRNRVEITGWPELVDALASFEGGPISGVAIGMGNEPDLVFEGEVEHAPFLTLGIYADGNFAFSEASRDDLLAQCKSDAPAWADSEEDVEAYLELEGLAAINTALIRHKQRFFFRDESTVEAPALYVESVLAGWFRVLRFHQAVAAQLDAHGLPGDVPVITGIFGMTPDAPTVHYAEKKITVSSVEVAPLVIKPRVQRVEAMVDLSGSSIRRAVNDVQPVESPAPSGSFLRRLFGRG
jgi:hypothetical protein